MISEDKIKEIVAAIRNGQPVIANCVIEGGALSAEEGVYIGSMTASVRDTEIIRRQEAEIVRLREALAALSWPCEPEYQAPQPR
jgi:hypothetical protein